MTGNEVVLKSLWNSASEPEDNGKKPDSSVATELKTENWKC